MTALPSLELLELERIWPERYRPRPLALACRAVCAETGKRCTLPAHKGEHSASGRRFTETLASGAEPHVRTVLDFFATSRVQESDTYDEKARNRRYVAESRARAKARRSVVDRTGVRR